MRASSSRRLSRRTRTSTTSMPPLGEASACSSSGSDSTRQCGVRVAAHRLARSTPCGVPNSRSNRSACSGAPCSSVAKIEPPSSLTTTIVRSGSGSCTSWTRPLASCRNVTSPISAKLLVESRPRAAPMAELTVPSMPERPRLAMVLRRPPTSYRGTIRSRSRTGLEAPTTSSPPRGSARATAPATSYGVRSASSRSSRSSPWLVSASAVFHRSNQSLSSGPSTVARTSRCRSTANGRSLHAPGVGTESTSTSSRCISRITGRLRVGCPNTTTRSTSSASGPPSSSR